jgi:cell division protein FtsL
MSSSSRLAMAALWVGLLAAAIAVVWSKHQARSLFIELQALHAERDALDIE